VTSAPTSDLPLRSARRFQTARVGKLASQASPEAYGISVLEPHLTARSLPAAISSYALVLEIPSRCGASPIGNARTCPPSAACRTCRLREMFSSVADIGLQCARAGARTGEPRTPRFGLLWTNVARSVVLFVRNLSLWPLGNFHHGPPHRLYADQDVGIRLHVAHKHVVLSVGRYALRMCF